ncbi:MAG: bifunctional hydroxymethylpyrimidine kinase/phosphomethylpyrimidine kinase [bacterium]
MKNLPVALTIAGSDSGGGAGIQADLKTFTALGVFGVSAITCITAQNPNAITGIETVSPKLIAAQIKAVTGGFQVVASKTGMLFSADIIHTVAKSLKSVHHGPLIVDPVMVATSGTRLLKQDAMLALFREILPLATVITPNLDEAEILAGCRIHSLKELQMAARVIAKRFGAACVAKGGHLEGGKAVDVLCVDNEITLYTAPRVRRRGTHGTGCMFSAALTAALAKGEDLHEAVAIAKHFVTTAIGS